MSFARLSPRQADLLGEISNVGVGHAATALSQMIGHEINMRVPSVKITPFNMATEAVGGPERVVAAVYCSFMGNITGHILLVLPRESANSLARTLVPVTAAPGAEWTEEAASSIREVGNILASAYLNALGSMLEMTLIPSVPSIAYDMAGAILDPLLIEQGRTGDLALLIETEFFERGETLKGQFFLVPDPEAVSQVISMLGAPRE
ncbi:MAG: chemotaxis protein CheC [Myxococcota bacterium]